MADNDCLIDGAAVLLIMKYMRSPTQRTTKNYANNARRTKETLAKDTFTLATIEAIMVALGLFSDHAGTKLLDGEETEKLTQYIISIADCALDKISGKGLDVSTHSSDKSFSEVIP